MFIRKTTDEVLDGDPGEAAFPDRLVLHEIASDLKDTQDALKWVKKNAENHEGATLVIAQIKQTITCTVKKVVQVVIEEV